MATTCGSPCYAAPELVVNTGLYAGSAVDVWSCGVILYAMLCGFLPFDDDPSNPEGDDINQLYRYILSTHLIFPKHLSSDACNLLGNMLVSDPTKRCSLEYIIEHPWLGPYHKFLKKDAVQIQTEATVASRSSTMPNNNSDSNLNIGISMSTSLPRKETASGVSAGRRTLIPVVSHNRYAPVSNDKYAVNNSKLSNNVIENADTSTKSSTFRHFAIGRSSATTNISEKKIHATNITPVISSPGTSNSTTRNPVKQEKAHRVNNDSAIVVSNLIAENTDTHSRNINPEKSLSSPTSTIDSKFPMISTFGSIRRGENRGTDKFFTFFTSSLSSHIPLATKKQGGMPSIFNDENQKNDIFYVRPGVHNAAESVHGTADHAIQDPVISCSNETSETDERLPPNHDKSRHSILYSSSETSIIGESTPSLCSSSPLNSTTDPLEPMSPALSPSQHESSLQVDPSRQVTVHTDMPTSSIIHQKSEGSKSITSEQQCSRVKGRRDSIRTTSILFEHQNAVSNNNVVLFKETPRRNYPLIIREQTSHQQHRGIDNNSSIRSVSIGEQQDNASASSYGTYHQPVVSNSSRLKSVENGGRHVMEAVRRSIYRKHKSQPPPPQHSEENSISTATEESTTSFAKRGIEENYATQRRPHRDRNTWCTSTRTTSGVPLLTNKKKVYNSTVTITVSKKAGNKMMDWIKKKSHGKCQQINQIKYTNLHENTFTLLAKDIKTEANETITSKTTPSKFNPSVQIVKKSRKMNSIKKEVSPAAAVTVASPTEKSALKKTFASSSSSPKTKVLTSSKNRKNVVSTQMHPAKDFEKQKTLTSMIAQTSKSSADPSSLVMIPERNSTRSKRAISGSEAIPADRAKNDIEDDRIQIHQGAIDRTALTSQSPTLVIKDAMRILRILGIDANLESTFVLKCCRRRAKSFIAIQLLRRKRNEDEGEDNCVNQDDDEKHDNGSIDELSIASSDLSSSAIKITSEKGLEPIYGDASIDNGDEIRFSVEICRFKNLPGLYIVDIRRLRGNPWAYKFLYNKLLNFLDLKKISYLKSSS